MRCLSPITFRQQTTNQLITVPCGKCNACLSRRRQQWSFRLQEELKVSSSAFFITLTYVDENLTYGSTQPTVVKADFQKFMKRFRDQIKPHKVRYYACSEYGSRTFRPHYHFIVFNFPTSFDLSKVLDKSWSLGFYSIGDVNVKSINYVTKYCLSKTHYPDDVEKPFMLCSRRPGLGSAFLSSKMSSFLKSSVSEVVQLEQGRIRQLPRYYKDKIFDNQYLKDKLREKQDAYVSQLDALYYDKYGGYDFSVLEQGGPCMQTQLEADFNRRIEKNLSKIGKL